MGPLSEISLSGIISAGSPGRKMALPVWKEYATTLTNSTERRAPVIGLPAGSKTKNSLTHNPYRNDR
jgi:hypothetical protein